jgi:hypothetical protein
MNIHRRAVFGSPAFVWYQSFFDSTRSQLTRAFWTAPAERSGDGALALPVRVDKSSALGVGQSGVALSLCHRTPK